MVYASDRGVGRSYCRSISCCPGRCVDCNTVSLSRVTCAGFVAPQLVAPFAVVVLILTGRVGKNGAGGLLTRWRAKGGS